jgi:hypothetical protein
MLRDILMACLIVATHTKTDKKPTIPAKHQIGTAKSASVQVSKTELDWLVDMSHERFSVQIRNDLWITSE